MKKEIGKTIEKQNRDDRFSSENLLQIFIRDSLKRQELEKKQKNN